MEIPKIQPGLPKTILTQKEVETILSLPDTSTVLGYRDKTILELLYSTGIRNSELRDLRLKDIDLDNRTLLIRKGKGRKDRIIPLTKISSLYLAEYLEKIRPILANHHSPITNNQPEEEVLFLTARGSPLSKERLCEILQRYARESKIPKPITPHILRHSIATHLLENGMSIRYIQALLGHRTLSTTQKYAQVTIRDLRKVYNRYHPREKRESVIGCR